ncbi:flagellar motor switch protein FliM [Candidatus Poribacteria bacterium]|nr:flagellar motor switch protein FliM [Candidatus Poribacteria bacterium]
MADILSQEEVDALLAAVSEGEVQVEKPEAPTKRAHVAKYDFKRPERVSKEQFRGFQTLSEVFARDLSTALGGSLRAVARVSVVSVDQITYDEYVLSISNPTSYNVIQLPPIEGNLILEFNPALIFPIIDRLLGGRGVAIAKPRELTEIEQKLVAKIVELVLTTLVRAWRHLAEFAWKLVAQENDPQIVQIVTGSEIVLALKFELTVGDISGSMSLCLPVVAIEPMLDKIGAEYTFYGARPQHRGPQTARMLEEIVMRTRTQVEAYMAGSVIAVSDLLKLQVGDIVRLDNNVIDESCITLAINGMPKFSAKQGRVGNRQAIQVVNRLE